MFKKILVLTITFFLIWINLSFAENSLDTQLNTNNVWNPNNKTNSELNIIWTITWFIWLSDFWAKWLKDTLFTIARDMKNLFFAISTVFFLIITIKVLMAENSEEEFAHYKTWIVWITIWIIVMQSSFSFAKTIFDAWAWEELATALATNIIEPLIRLLEFMASLFFIWAAIYSFIRLISAWWNEEIIKKWKYSIISALLWFIIVKFARLIIEKIQLWDCSTIIAWTIKVCKLKTDLSWFTKIFLNFLNWANSFIAIITLIMIIYAWVLILLSWWEEEKLKKWKHTIIYALIWVFLLVINYLILTFFILPETNT